VTLSRQLRQKRRESEPKLSDEATGWNLIDQAQGARAGGDLASANLHLDNAELIFTENSELRGLALVLHQRAALYLSANRLSEASVALSRAGSAFQELGDEQGVAHVYFATGDLRRLEGDLEEALKSYLSSHSAYLRCEDELGSGSAARSIAEMLLQLGDVEGALPYAEEAIKRHTEIDHLLGLAAAFRIRAMIAQRVDPSSAAGYVERAIGLSRDAGDSIGSAALLVLLAEVARDNGDYPAARLHFASATAIFRKLGDLKQCASTLLATAKLELVMGHSRDSLIRLKEANEAAITSGMRSLFWHIESARASVYFAEGEFPKSLESYRAAAVLAEQDKDPRSVPRALSKLALVQESSGDFGGAARDAARSARASLRVGDVRSAAFNFGFAGGLLEKAGLRQSAALPFTSSLALFSALGFDEQSAKLSYTLAEIAKDGSRWDDCLDLCEDTIIRSEMLGDLSLAGMARMIIADVMLWTGNVAAAVQAVDLAQANFSTAGDEIARASALRSRAELHRVTADYESAEALTRVALEIYLRHQEYTGAGNSMLLLGDIAGQRGDSEAKYHRVNEALSCYRRSGDLPGTAMAAHSMAGLVPHGESGDQEFDSLEGEAGALYEKLNDLMGLANVQRKTGERYRLRDPARARAALGTALEIYEATTNHVGIATTCQALAGIETVAGNYSAAASLLDRAESAAIVVNAGTTRGDILSLRASLAQAQDEIELAISLHHQALLIFEDFGELGGLSVTGIFLPGLLRRQGREVEALSVLRRVLSAIRSSTRWIDSTSSRKEYLGRIANLRGFALELASEIEEPSVAREFIELGAAALVPGLGRLLTTGAPNAHALKQVQSVAAITASLATLEAETPENPNLKIQKLLHIERAARRRELIADLTRILGHDLRRIIDPAPTDPSPNLALLADGGVAVLQVALTPGVHLADTIDIVWTMPHREPVHVRTELLGASKIALGKLFALHGEGGASGDVALSDFFRMIDGGCADEGFLALSAQLLPVELIHALEVANVDRLIVSPDERLWNVPWSALCVASERRLVDLVSVSLTTSIGVLAPDRVGPTARRPVHGWFADVDDIQTEIVALREAFGDDFVLADTSQSLMTKLAHDDVEIGTVVLSVHGQSDEGLAHGVVLAPGVELTAAHLIGWRMPDTLIIGSCWTARLSPDPAADQVAITTLAVAKGARNVIGGIFPLPDEDGVRPGRSPTAALLASFYRRLPDESVAHALWSAQKEHRYRPAHQWAGLIHVAGSAQS